MSLDTYELGHPVTITGTAAKYKNGYGTVKYIDGPVPMRNNYDNPRHFHEGIIVGSRHVTGGTTTNWDEGRAFVPTTGTSRRVWLVAFDMYMKPVMCFDHQVKPLKEES